MTENPIVWSLSKQINLLLNIKRLYYFFYFDVLMSSILAITTKHFIELKIIENSFRRNIQNFLTSFINNFYYLSTHEFQVY